jgi:PAS domain S-box-containing protein
LDNRALQSDTRFEALAESAPDAILSIDEASTIRFANAAVERVFGYVPDEIVGRPLHVLIPERLRAAHDRGFQRYLSSGTKSRAWTGIMLSGLKKDGTEVPIEISFGEFVDEGGTRAFSGFIRDISDRVRAARELETAHANAEKALRELTRLAHVVDVAISQRTYDDMLRELLRTVRQELEADEATVLLVDANKQDLVVRAIDDVGGVVEDDGVSVRIGAGFAGKVASSRRPAVIADMSTVSFISHRLSRLGSVVAVPILAGDEVIGVIHAGSRQKNHFSGDDVRLLEIVSERMAGVLARTQLFQEMERLRDEAQHAVRSRDEVLSIVSHDLRNPVSTVMMAASLLKDPEIKLDEEQRQSQLDVIIRSGQRMNRLIQDLLDIARMEGKRFAINCGCEDAGTIVTEACDSFRVLAREKSIELTCHVDELLPKIYADRDRILQVLSNFLNNALKFTPSEGRVQIRAQRTDDGGVRYSVNDTGPGIPSEELPHVFQRFWQSKHTAHLGAGLGLAIAAGIAEAHKGRVAVESEVGKGSTFTLELPPSDNC